MLDNEPLASKLRPTSLAEFYGQSHLLKPGLPLYEAITHHQLHSMILWGPPGSGKTTLAKIMAHSANAKVEELSAVLSGVKDIRAAMDRALSFQKEGGLTVLFVDEVHRFNKSQQDAFLPFVERGVVTFIGATTENPAFELNNALLSRAAIYVLKPLSDKALLSLIRNTLNQVDITISEPNLIIDHSQGDARKCLNYLELAIGLAQKNNQSTIDKALIKNILSTTITSFDKGGDNFYDQISALHKSIRGSSPDASLFWCLSMLKGGCSPQYVLRRLLRIASEDIGNADPKAASIVLTAWDSFDRLGMPEGELTIAQAAIYLACAPKSNAVYKAYKQCKLELGQITHYEVPIHLKNAPTRLSQQLNHGRDYNYPHDYPYAYVPNENYFPKSHKNQYYAPVERGLEFKIKQKLEFFKQLDQSG